MPFGPLGIPQNRSYEQRLDAMQAHDIARWDVLQSCQRKDSLDTSIKNKTPNDFVTFFDKYRQIKTILFNGQKAETVFRQHVLKRLRRQFDIYALPSTSPTNASIKIGNLDTYTW